MPQGVDGTKISQAEWARLIATMEPAYTVFKIGTTYYAESTLPSGIDYSSTVGATEIQHALDGLTVGRTWQEKVLLKGDLTIDTTLSVPPYTVLQIDGKLTLADGSNCDMIRNKNFDTALDWYIAICGGIIDGGTQTATSNGIHFQGAQRSSIFSCRIKNMFQRGIWLDAGAAFNTGVCHVLNNWIEDSANGIVVSTSGAAVSADHIICNNDVGGCTSDGILLSAAGACNVSDNLCWNNALGIDLYNATGTSICDNRADWNDWFGIRLSAASVDNTLTGNRCWTNGVETPDLYAGIQVLDSNSNVICGNISRNYVATPYQKYGIQVSGTSDYNTVKGNNCTLNVTAPYSVVGAHNSYDGIVRTAVAADLSGGAVTLVCLHPEQALHLARANLLYTEASSADAGITVEIGKESDRDYYYTGATEINKALWYTKEVTLLKNDVAAGDTVTFYSPGSKTGTGEIILILEYLTGAN